MSYCDAMTAFPAYNLAVVVDDALSGVDQVVRGNDLLPGSSHPGLPRRSARPPAAHIRPRAAGGERDRSTAGLQIGGYAAAGRAGRRLYASRSVTTWPSLGRRY